MTFFKADGLDTSSLLQVIGDLYEDGPWEQVLQSLRVAMKADEVILTLRSETDGTVHTITARDIPKDSDDLIEKGQAANWPMAGYDSYADSAGRWSPSSRSRRGSATRGRRLSFSLGTVGERHHELHILRNSESLTSEAADRKLLDDLVPHLARAARMRAAFAEAELAQNLHAEPLDRLTLGSVIVDMRMRVVGANTAARRVLSTSDGLLIRRGQLHAADSDDHSTLVRAVAGAVNGSCAPSGTALFARRPTNSGNLALVVKSLRMKDGVTRQAQNAAVILIGGIQAVARDSCGLFRQLFNFTPTEATLAVDFVNGLCVEEIEQQYRIKHNTTRAHLRSMYQKMGVSRYGEMIQLLANHASVLEREFRPTMGGKQCLASRPN